MNPGFSIDRRLFCGGIFLAIIIALPAGASAQTEAVPKAGVPAAQASPSPSPTPSLEREFFKNILRDQRAIWTSPRHLHGKDAKWLVPLGLSTAALIATDRGTAGALHDDRLRLNISRDVSYLASGYGASAIAASLYLIGRARGDARMRETGLLSAEALIDDVVVYSALKVATERTRPRKDLGRGRFFHGGFSFPSGHAVAVWSLAAVVASEYKDRPLIKFGAYALATAVSISRFTGRNHFLSDVLVGSAIGYGIGRYVYHAHHDAASGDDTTTTTQTKRFTVIPLIAPRQQSFGVSVAWRL